MPNRSKVEALQSFASKLKSVVRFARDYKMK